MRQWLWVNYYGNIKRLVNIPHFPLACIFHEVADIWRGLLFNTIRVSYFWLVMNISP